MRAKGLPVVERRTDVTPDLDQELLKKLCPPYKVILHNDDDHDFDFVIISVLKSVPSLSPEDVVEVVMTAHNEGTAVVVVAPQETAEFYQERILSFGLGCTIEPDN